MGLEFTFLIYVTLFRLAIIAAGVISIVLGYRLLCRGVWPSDGSRQGTTVTAEIAGSRFTLKNAAPGTCFALFGVLIISIMFAKGVPELTLERLQEGGGVQRTIVRGNGKGARQASTQQGNGAESFHTLTQKGIAFARQGNHQAAAITTLRQAMTLVTLPMNVLAWLYQEQGQFDEALPLARLAVRLKPHETAFLDTLAIILCQTGEHSEAIRFMEEAVRLKPNDEFRKRLEKFQTGSCQ